jgi:hypothetical protein
MFLDFIKLFGLLALSTALVVLPIVLACICSPLWLMLLILTMPFAVVYFYAAITMQSND